MPLAPQFWCLGHPSKFIGARQKRSHPPLFCQIPTEKRAREMEFKVVYTKMFNGCLRTLDRPGHKKPVQAVRAAISEAGMNGDIKSLPRTKHGETGIPKRGKIRAQGC
jgi:hypothetical protein